MATKMFVKHGSTGALVEVAIQVGQAMRFGVLFWCIVGTRECRRRHVKYVYIHTHIFIHIHTSMTYIYMPVHINICTCNDSRG